jgi:hypothetical protein
MADNCPIITDENTKAQAEQYAINIINTVYSETNGTVNLNEFANSECPQINEQQAKQLEETVEQNLKIMHFQPSRQLSYGGRKGKGKKVKIMHGGALLDARNIRRVIYFIAFSVSLMVAMDPDSGGVFIALQAFIGGRCYTLTNWILGRINPFCEMYRYIITLIARICTLDRAALFELSGIVTALTSTPSIVDARVVYLSNYIARLAGTQQLPPPPRWMIERLLAMEGSPQEVASNWTNYSQEEPLDRRQSPRLQNESPQQQQIRFTLDDFRQRRGGKSKKSKTHRRHKKSKTHRRHKKSKTHRRH